MDADNDGTEELLIRYNNSDAACETYSFYLPVKAEKFYPFFNKTAVPTKGKLHFRVFSPLHPPGQICYYINIRKRLVSQKQSKARKGGNAKMKSGKKRLMQFLMLCGLLGIFMMPTQAAAKNVQSGRDSNGTSVTKTQNYEEFAKATAALVKANQGNYGCAGGF